LARGTSVEADGPTQSQSKLSIRCSVVEMFPDGRRDSTFGFETRQAVRGGAFYFDRCSNSHLNYGGLIPSTDLEPAAGFSQLVLEAATLGFDSFDGSGFFIE